MKRTHTVMAREESSTSAMEKELLPPTEELIDAVSEGQVDTVKCLLESNMYDVNALFDRHEKYEDGCTIFHKPGLLHLASAHGHVSTVSTLLSAGADVNLGSEGSEVIYDKKYDKTALGCAILGSHVDVFKLLLKQEGLDVDAFTHFHNTISGPALQLVIAVSTDSNSKLTLDQRKDMMVSLVEAGADIRLVGHWGKTLLFDLCEYDNGELLEWALSDPRMDLSCLFEMKDREERTPLYRAVEKALSPGDVWHLLVGRRLKDREERTPLYPAVEKALSPEDVWRLLGGRLGISVKAHWENVILLLIRNGADPNPVKASGYSALYRALRDGYTNPKVYPLLLEHGADEAQLLHFCCNREDRDPVNAMLDRGCKVVNAKCSNGLYPFQVVASEWDFEYNMSLTTLFRLLSDEPHTWVSKQITCK